MAFAVKGVGWQHDSAVWTRSVEGVPVHVVPLAVEPSQAGVQDGHILGGGALSASSEAGQPGGGSAHQAEGAHAGQDGVRSDLHEVPGSGLGQRGHAVGESHRLPSVGHPVLRAGDLVLDEATREVGHERDERRRQFHRCQQCSQLVQDRLDQDRVTGRRDVEGAGLDASSIQVGTQTVNGLGVSGHDGAERPVDGGDRHLGDDWADQVTKGLLRRQDRCHAAWGGQAMREHSAPCGADP